MRPHRKPDPDDQFQIARGNTHKGNETAKIILEQTKNIVAEHGFAAVSIRSVADKCCISPSNVTYYFKTKEILFEELAKFIFERWTRRFYDRMPSHIAGAHATLKFSIEYMINENKRPKTMTMLLEMWAMSNHSPAVLKMMDIFYTQMRLWIESLLHALNAGQTAALRQRRAALITAQIEGLMLLIGPNRIQHSELQGLEAEALAQILHLATAE